MYLKKRRAILKKLNTKYLCKTHKYVVDLSETISKASQLGENYGKICEDMRSIIRCTEIPYTYRSSRTSVKDTLPRPHNDTRRPQSICYHMSFDVKINYGFTFKAWLVSYGHNLDSTSSIIYVSVLLSVIIPIVIILVSLNFCDVLCSNVHNAYLDSKPK